MGKAAGARRRMQHRRDAPPSRCHVHHVVPWSEGGGTSVKDGRLYCSAHHAMVHDPKRSGRLRT